MPIPGDFIRFEIPGHEPDADALRALYWRHFLAEGPEWDVWVDGNDHFPMYPVLPSGPKVSLWDEWLCGPMLAVASEGISERMRRLWAKALSNRRIDDEGGVESANSVYERFYAHPVGWPFPVWSHGRGGFGWHFSFKGTVGELDTPNGRAFRPPNLTTPEGWNTNGAPDAELDPHGWRLAFEGSDGWVETPECAIETQQSPFLQLRWKSSGLDDAQPHVEWMTADDSDYSSERRFYFDPAEGDEIRQGNVPVFRHPKWTGVIKRLRLRFGNRRNAVVVIQGLCSQYDTRHSINNLNFARGCALTFGWTRDFAFLRANVGRLRRALRGFMAEHRTREENIVLTTWFGHDGLSAIVRGADGSKTIRYGHGLPGNYWDILPFGHKDAYTTVHYYDTLQVVAGLEEEILEHPEWNIPRGPETFSPEDLRSHAAQVREVGNRVFWNAATGRFYGAIDAEGTAHDYGFTFVNLEAIRYGFATEEHAESILTWIAGERIVESDTSQGADIYGWRIAPRTTTRHNRDWWYWAYDSPERIPFGTQIQDGGAVLGFSYYDLMARLRVRGADDAWNRLREILAWFRETQAAGGYKAYYAGKEGTMQGANVGGALGIENEFFESLMVPHIVVSGFLGFEPTGGGFRIAPRLPSAWDRLRVAPIAWHGRTLSVEATAANITVRVDAASDAPVVVRFPSDAWRVEDHSRGVVGSSVRADGNTSVLFDFAATDTLRLVRR